MNATAFRSVDLIVAVVAAVLVLSQRAVGQDAFEPPAGVAVESFGKAVSAIPDLTGDSVDEVAIGATIVDPNQIDPPEGVVWVFNGATGEIIREFRLPSRFIPALDDPDGSFGAPIAAIADIDGDDIADIVIGAREHAPATPGFPVTGAIHFMSGATGEAIQSFQPEIEGQFGVSLVALKTAAGGPSTIVVAGMIQPDATGLVTVIDASDFQVPAVHPFGDEIPDTVRGFGMSLAALVQPIPTAAQPKGSEVVSSLLVGAFGADGEGEVFLYEDIVTRTPPIAVFRSPNAASMGRFGGTLSSLRDLNGNGYPELLVSAAGENPRGRPDFPSGGRVYLFDSMLNNDGAPQLLGTLRPPTVVADGMFGAGLTGIRDVTGDGLDDLLVGSNESVFTGPTTELAGAGRVYVFDGAGRRLVRVVNPPLPETGGSFGRHLAEIAAAGSTEFAVTAPGDPVVNPGATGSAFQFAGQTAGARVARLSGRIADGVTDEPLACAVIRAASPEFGPFIVTTDFDGVYAIEDMPPATYLIEAIAPGYNRFGVERQVREGRDEEAQFTLAPSNVQPAVFGAVTDSRTFQPLGGVSVQAFLNGVELERTFTCLEGRYELILPNIKQNEVTVTLLFSTSIYNPLEVDVTITRGVPEEVNVMIGKTIFPTTLVGTVLENASGDPLADVTVALTNQVVAPTVKTGADGSYTLEAIEPGSFVVNASKDGFATGSVFVALAEGAVSVADFSLEAVDDNEQQNAGCGVSSRSGVGVAGDLGTVLAMLALITAAGLRRQAIRR